MSIKRAAMVFFALQLSACASVMPELRSSEEDFQGELVSGCQNLSRDHRVDKYITGSYLTTWTSAWREGSTAGLHEGLSGENSIQSAVRRALDNPRPGSTDVFDDALIPVQPFCMVFERSRREVAVAIANAMKLTGNPILASDVERGIFQTDLLERSHRAAKWKDAYTITVAEERTNRVVVRILRSVYISRQGSPFHRATSSGHNEAWILTHAMDQLNKTK